MSIEKGGKLRKVIAASAMINNRSVCHILCFSYIFLIIFPIYFQVTVAVSDRLFDTAACGSDYGCFLHPPGCNLTDQFPCYAMASFRPIDDDFVEFLLAGQSVSGGDNSYVALGFSHNREMASDYRLPLKVLCCFLSH